MPTDDAREEYRCVHLMGGGGLTEREDGMCEDKRGWK